MCGCEDGFVREQKLAGTETSANKDDKYVGVHVSRYMRERERAVHVYVYICAYTHIHMYLVTCVSKKETALSRSHIYMLHV